MTATIMLYEDNAGSLTLVHGTDVYTGLEHLTDGTTLVDCAAILAGDHPAGCLAHFRAYDHPGPTEYDSLVATVVDGELDIVGRPGIAARILLGMGDE